MTGAPPDRGDRAPAQGSGGSPARATLIVMALVLVVSMLIFVWGFLSLLLDRDVVEEQDAGPLVGPAMVVAVCVVVLLLLLRASTTARPVLSAIAAGLATAIGAPVLGGIVYVLARGEAAVFIVFVGRQVLDPFVLAAAIIAALVVLAAALVLRARR